MVQPVVTSVTPTPAEPRMQLLVTGNYFGFVNDAFFEAASDGTIYNAGFTQVFDGEHALVTVPSTLPVNADYTVILVTIEDEASINDAGLLHVQPISGTIPPPLPAPTPNPLPLPAPGVSVGLDRIRSRTRLELVDPSTPFQAKSTGDGQTTRFDFPVRHVDPASLVVNSVPASGDPVTTLTTPTNYLLDAFKGEITLTAPLADGATLYATGTRYRFFDNDSLDTFIETAFTQLTHGRTITTETFNQYGYREYAHYNFTYDTLPEVEILPLAILAKIEALWVLATDASYDLDIQADGANIPRTERYRQLLGQIQAEQARFDNMAQMLNIGLNRIEMSTLRRISRQTGRLVPVYTAKEYDDRSLPVRVLPGIDQGQGEGDVFVDPYYMGGADYGGGYGP